MVSEDEQKLLQELQAEHEKLSQLNHQLQNKLSEYFLLESGTKHNLLHGKVFTKEDCLQKYPGILEKVKREMEHKRQKQLEQHHVDELNRQNDEKLEQIEREQSMLASTEREMLITFLEQAMGKTEAQAEAERLLMAAQECEDEYVSVRQENFKMNSKVLNLEAGLHARERALDGDMHKIDFEQLQIENETYKDKLEECKEDLIKLKKMIPHNDQVCLFSVCLFRGLLVKLIFSLFIKNAIFFHLLITKFSKNINVFYFLFFFYSPISRSGFTKLFSQCSKILVFSCLPPFHGCVYKPVQLQSTRF